jgi:DNA-binding winged helix-turn-helix (wHTH) protein
VNLALRRTADHLLRLAGDDSSRIAPVVQAAPHVWEFQLEGSFSYDALPPLLAESLNLHDISQGYEVSVTDCEKGDLVLGYNFRDLTESTAIPCSGREAPQLGCQQVRVSFPVQMVRPKGFPLSGITFSMGIALTFFTLGRARKVDLSPAPALVSPPDSAVAEKTDSIRIGTAVLEVSKLTLTCGGNTIALTYREAKLLQVFGQHPDEVLERNFLLEKVWGEEGIQVSRSLDVFVSRLRKHLKDAPEVQIVAVHGVGYRLTVQQA